jgi:hypothetical protein
VNCDRPAPVGRSAAATAVCVAQKQRGIHSAPPPESGAWGRCLQPGRQHFRVGRLALFRGGSGWPRLRKGWFDTFGSEGLSVGVGGGRRSPRTDMAYADAPRHSDCRRRRFWRCKYCWANQQSSQMRRFQHWSVVAARRRRVCRARYRRMECRRYQHCSSRATALTAFITHGFLSANPGCLDILNAKRW